MTKFAYVNNDSVFYNYSEDIVRVEETNFFNSDTKVIILRGISGSGKSTVAKKFIADNVTLLLSRAILSVRTFLVRGILSQCLRWKRLFLKL